MKRIIRIAPLLIVLALGIESIPGAKAITSHDDSIVTVKKSKKIKELKGIRVDPKPIDLLWQKESENKSEDLMHPKTSFSEKLIQKGICQSGTDYKTELPQPELFYSMNIQENGINCCLPKNIKHYE